MGETFIILNLKTLKIVRKCFKPLMFDCYSDAYKYAEKYLNEFKLIKL